MGGVGTLWPLSSEKVAGEPGAGSNETLGAASPGLRLLRGQAPGRSDALPGDWRGRRPAEHPRKPTMVKNQLFLGCVTARSQPVHAEPPRLPTSSPDSEPLRPGSHLLRKLQPFPSLPQASVEGHGPLVILPQAPGESLERTQGLRSQGTAHRLPLLGTHTP